MIPFNRYDNGLMSIPGIFSTVGSSFIIVSYFLFPKLRDSEHLEVLLYVTINDFLTSIGMCYGFAKENTVGCYYQAFTSLYTSTVSNYWTAAMSYQLVTLVKYNKVFKPSYFVHFICWLAPLPVSILSFATRDIVYGIDDTSRVDQNLGWCFYQVRTHSKRSQDLLQGFYIWYYVTAWAPLFFVLYNLFVVRKTLLAKNLPEVASKFLNFTIYPVVLVICWVIISMVDFIDFFFDADNNVTLPPQTSLIFSILSFSTAAIIGFINSTVFIARSRVLLEWKKMILKLPLMRDLFPQEESFLSTLADSMAQSSMSRAPSEVQARSSSALFPPHRSVSKTQSTSISPLRKNNTTISTRNPIQLQDEETGSPSEGNLKVFGDDPSETSKRISNSGLDSYYLEEAIQEGGTQQHDLHSTPSTPSIPIRGSSLVDHSHFLRAGRETEAKSLSTRDVRLDSTWSESDAWGQTFANQETVDFEEDQSNSPSMFGSRSMSRFYISDKEDDELS